MAADGSIIINTELDNSGFKAGSDEILKAIREVVASINTLSKQMSFSFSQITPLISSLVVNIRSITDAILLNANAINQQGQAIDAVDRSTHDAGQNVDQGATDVENGARRIIDSSREVEERGGSHFVEFGNRVRTAAGNILRLVGNLAKLSFRTITRGISKLTSHIRLIGHNSRAATLSTQSLIKGLLSLKTMLIGRLKSMFIKEVTQAIQNGLKALRQYSSSFNAAMNNIKNSSTELGANISVSIGNLVKAIEPALTAIINAVSQAISYINALFAMLGGKNTVIVAKKQMADYGAATESAAGSAERLNRQVYGFDQLNRRSSNSGGGGGGSSSLEDLFEEKTIESLLPETIQSFFDKIKAAFENQQWYTLGYVIGEGLNAGLQKVDDWINNTLRPKGVEWARRIAEILNGLTDGFNWKLLGKTIADGINTAFDIENTFLKKYNFGNLGKKVGEAINELIAETDWSLIGETIARKLNAALDFLYNLGNEIRWRDVGHSIATAINKFVTTFNWTEAAQTINVWAKGVLNTFAQALKDVDWKKLGESVKTFLMEIDWKGIWRDLWEVIGAASGGIEGFLEGLLGTSRVMPNQVLEDLFNEWWDKLFSDGDVFQGGGAGKSFAITGGGGRTSGNGAKRNKKEYEIYFDDLVGHMETAADLIKEKVTIIESDYERMHTAAVDSLRGQIDIWGDAADKTKVSVSAMIENIQKQIRANRDYQDNFKTIVQSEIEISDGLLAKVSSNTEDARILAATLAEALKDGNVSLVQALSDAYAEYDQSNSDLLHGIDATKEQLAAKGDEITSTVTTIKDSVLAVFNGLPEQLRAAGVHAIEGLINGMNAKAPDAAATAGELSASVIRRTRNVMQEQSPSRVFKEIGQYAIEGLIIGMQDRQNAALLTSERLADSVIDTMGGLVVPQIAAGSTVPPKVQVGDDVAAATELGLFSGNVDEYMSDTNFLLRRIIEILQRLNPNIDADSLATALTSAQRRTQRAYGGA